MYADARIEWGPGARPRNRPAPGRIPVLWRLRALWSERPRMRSGLMADRALEQSARSAKCVRAARPRGRALVRQHWAYNPLP